MNHIGSRFSTLDIKVATMLPVNIDFDAAQQAWRANKVYLGQGMFRYKKTTRKSIQHSNKKLKKNISISSKYNLRPRKLKT